MGFIVDYDELNSIEQKVQSKCNEWLSVLEKARGNVENLAKTDSVQGDLANSVGTYLNEVHSFSLGMIMSALATLRTRICLYWAGYRNNIDSDYHAHIREEDLENVRQHFFGIIDGVTDVDDELSRAVWPIRDLIYLSTPSSTRLLEALDEVRNRCRKLEQSIAEHESSHASSDFEMIDGIITNIQTLIDNQTGDKHIKVRDYRPGMVAVMTNVTALMDCYHAIQDYEDSVSDELSEALEQEQQMLQDIEDERQWAKWVAVGICVIGSVALIAVTAGGATPLVCAGVGAASGLVSAAANNFANNFVVNGDFVEGMDWADFGKDCIIGTVTGAVTGYGGAIAHGSSVVKPLERAMMKTATGVVESGSRGVINFAFDMGEAIVAQNSTFESILTAASDSVENMMRDVVVGMATDAAGGYVGGMFDTSSADKGFWQTLGEETVGNLAEKEAQIGAGVTFDVFTGVTSGGSGIDILNTIDIDMQEGTQAFIEDEFSSALSSGFDSTIDSKFDNDKSTSGKIWKGAYKAVNDTATNTAGKFASGVVGQVFDGEGVDVEKVWRDDLGGGTEILKSAGESVGKSVSDEAFHDRQFKNMLDDHDYDHDGKVDVVTFKNFSGYSVLKEDYDAAIEMAGKTGYKGKRAQDILGLPRNVSFSGDNVEVHKYSISRLEKSDYSGKGTTNAIRIEHK